MTYSITEQFNKRFIIDLGLRPGYEGGEATFSIDDVKEWYAAWQKSRAERELPYFAGIIASTHFVYVLKENGVVTGMHEPSVRIEGEIAKEYHGGIFDDEQKILEIIFDLATTLGTNAKQERVHVMFNNKFLILK